MSGFCSIGGAEVSLIAGLMPPPRARFGRCDRHPQIPWHDSASAHARLRLGQRPPFPIDQPLITPSVTTRDAASRHKARSSASRACRLEDLGPAALRRASQRPDKALRPFDHLTPPTPRPDPGAAPPRPPGPPPPPNPHT